MVEEYIHEMDEAAYQGIWDHQAHLANCCSSCGLAQTEVVGDGVEAVRHGELPDGYANLLLQS